MIKKTILIAFALVLTLPALLGVTPAWPADTESESNNGAGAATVVYPLQGVIDSVDTSDTFDFFTFDTGYGSTLKGALTINCSEPGLGARLYLRSTTGDTKVAEFGTNESTSRIIFDAHDLSLVSGTYLLRITYYSGFETEHKYQAWFGLYTEGCSPDTDNDFQSASPLTIGVDGSGIVCNDDVVDWWRINLGASYDGAVAILDTYVGTVLFSVYDGAGSSPHLVLTQAADMSAYGAYRFNLSGQAGTYYLRVAADQSIDAAQDYSITIYPPGQIDFDALFSKPALITVPDAAKAPGWVKKFAWKANRPVLTSPWTRISGDPANTGLSAYMGPNDPSIKWRTPMSEPGFDFKLDPKSLLDGGDIDVQKLIAGKIPYFSPSFQRTISEPIIDFSSGVVIAAATKEMLEVLTQESFSGINNEDGSVMWTLPGVASNGQALVAPGGILLLPGGGEAGVTGQGGISCYSTGLGELLWTIDTPNPILELNLLGNKSLVTGDGTGVRTYAMKDGKPGWSCIDSSKKGPRSLVTDDAGNIYGNFGGNLYRINADGHQSYKKEVASVDSGIPIFSKTMLGRDGRLFMSDSRGTVYCCDTYDGALNWKYPEKEEDKFGVGGILDLLDTQIEGLDKVDEYFSMIRTPALVVDMACLPDGKIVVAYRKKLIVLDAAGKQYATRNLDAPVGGGLSVDAAGAVYASIPDSAGVYHLEAMNEHLETVWALDGTEACSRPAIGPDGYLYVVNSKNEVICVG